MMDSSYRDGRSPSSYPHGVNPDEVHSRLSDLVNSSNTNSNSNNTPSHVTCPQNSTSSRPELYRTPPIPTTTHEENIYNVGGSSTSKPHTSQQQQPQTKYTPGDDEGQVVASELSKRRFKIDRVDSFKAGHSSSAGTSSGFPAKLPSVAPVTFGRTTPTTSQQHSINGNNYNILPNCSAPTNSNNSCSEVPRPIVKRDDTAPLRTTNVAFPNKTPNINSTSNYDKDRKNDDRPSMPPTTVQTTPESCSSTQALPPLHCVSRPQSMTTLQSAPQSPSSPSPPTFHRRRGGRCDSRGDIDNESTTESGITNGHTVLMSKESYSTFGQNTVEALPRLDHFFLEPFPEGYHNRSRRPTLAELHDIMEENKVGVAVLDSATPTLFFSFMKKKNHYLLLFSLLPSNTFFNINDDCCLLITYTIFITHEHTHNI